ncbi:hypothetical protein [Limoniibacter endophyticus]|uniref:DUF3618 domain-containing protein n=1 Tax=Limoniibacter endophyticus TaxID=1565040 RepID=A0A8J3GII4_9HYPH|nr:hypothetical protein [Limoniibacter endophyticus]GHC72412.1 hypothetical protein GCM10010136_20100 [Limoniibacter endophyticus]
MSSETEQLAREAESHRRAVDATIDSLKERMSLGQIIDELTSYAREGQAAEMVTNLKTQVKENPLALGLVGAGVAWLMLGDGSKHSATSGAPGSFASASNTAKGVASSAGEAAASAKDATMRAVHDMRDTASNVGSSAYHAGAQVGSAMSHGAQRARRTIVDSLHEEPLVIGAIALAIGAAVGASLPSTETEDRLVGDTSDRVKSGLAKGGSEAVETAKAVAADSYTAAASEADRQGLTPGGGEDTISEKVSSVVGAAADAAKQSFNDRT